MSVNNTPAKTPAQQASIPISIWFDMQPDAINEQVVPLWARELAQAHVDNDVYLLAHPDSAYAKMGLVCEIAKESLWPNDAWVERLSHTLALVKSKRIQQLILLLPHRSSPALWGQWSLIHLDGCGGWLDNLTGLLQGIVGWEEVLHRPDSNRWLMVDRVITYGIGTRTADFVTQMRAFNPMACWIHEGFDDKKVLLQSLNAYQQNLPLGRIPLKNDDLRAWGANKVVYFATSNEIDRAKVIDLFEKWRQQYGQKMVKLWAVVRIKDASSPLSVTSIHHLWASNTASHFSTHDFPESRFWILGEGLDAAQLQTEFEQCAA